MNTTMRVKAAQIYKDWHVIDAAGRPLGRVATEVAVLLQGKHKPTYEPHLDDGDFVLRHRIAISSELRMTLEVENTSSSAFTFEEALHTYFAVADVREASATGLEGASYLDKTEGFKAKTVGAEPLRFTGETDRVFPNHHGTCVIADRPTARRIVIEKSGSATTVVWNPWIAKAAAMADFGDEEWPQMLCIETANAGADAVTLAAGARHAMTAVVRAEMADGK